MRFRMVCAWGATGLLGAAAAFGLAIRVNGTCYVGNCATPDTLADGQSLTTPYNFTVTLANGDQYQLSGSVTASRSASTSNSACGGALSCDTSTHAATYLGNAAGQTPSAIDTLEMEFLQNNAGPPQSTMQEETLSVTPLFEGEYAASSTVAVTETIGPTALPELGPYGPTSAGGSETVPVQYQVGVPYLVDKTLIVTFGQGSGVGASYGTGSGATSSGGAIVGSAGSAGSGCAGSGSGSGACSYGVCTLVANDGAGSGGGNIGTGPQPAGRRGSARPAGGKLAPDASGSGSGAITECSVAVCTVVAADGSGSGGAIGIGPQPAGRPESARPPGARLGAGPWAANPANEGSGSGAGAITGCSIVAADGGGGAGNVLVSAPIITPGSVALDVGCTPAGTVAYYDDGNPPNADGVNTITIAADGGGGAGNIGIGPQPAGRPASLLPAAASGSGAGAACPSDGSGSAGNIGTGPQPAGVHEGFHEGIRGASFTAAAATSSSSSSSGTILPTVEVVTPVQASAAAYTATAACLDALGSTPCWLSVPVASGAVAAGSSTAVTAVLNPAGFAPGVYSGSVTIALTPSGAASSFLVHAPVRMLVTPAGPKLQLSQSGLNFVLTQGAASPPTQSLYVLDTEAGTQLTFSAATTGEPWLQVAPPSGPVSAGAPVAVPVQVNAAGLAPGSYSSRIDFSSPQAVNGTQSATVTLTVLPSSPAAGAGPGLTVSSYALAFAALFGTTPAAQTLQLSNPSNQTLTASFAAAYLDGEGWLSFPGSNGASGTPAGGKVNPAQPLTQSIAVNMAGYPAGVYRAVVTIQAAETGAAIPVQILSVVEPASCTPTQLNPLFANPAGGFTQTAGVPAPLDVLVVDDCGSPVTGANGKGANVTAYFPAALDTSIALTSLGNGHWTGSWLPRSLGGGAAGAAVVASEPGAAGLIEGSEAVTGTLAANASAPSIAAPGGVTNAASGVPGPVAPGEFIAIYGSNLAPSLSSSPGYPYATSLAGTQVILGGQALPLQFVSPGQINALVPFGAAPNGPQALRVLQNGVYSLPYTVTVAAANPAVFTQAQSGQGAGAIVVVEASGASFLATASQPAGAGDVLEIYCSGLGAVSPAVADGAAASLTAVSNTVNAVTATIGGQPAQVLFAGLAPGYAGLYQVDAVVPPGLAAGANVPVVLSQAGYTSATVTVALH